VYTIGVTAGSQGPTGWRFALPFALLCTIWSSTWLVIKDGLTALPPFSAAAIRFTIAAAVFTLIAPRVARREGGARPRWWLSLCMGVFNFGVSYGVVYWGEQVLPSGLASVLWATFPMLVVLVSLPVLPDERLSMGRLLGFLVAFAGVALLFVEDLRALGSDALVVGAVFLVSPLSAAIGQVIIKRYGAGVSSAFLNRNGMWIGAGILWGLVAPFEDPLAIEWTWRAAASVVYLAVFGTVVTFGLYYWLLRHASSSAMSLIAYVTPVAAVALGAAAGGEALTGSLATGAGLVLLGVAVARGRATSR
jgi:drug/metabolite transporter (DMT)-like permease